MSFLGILKKEKELRDEFYKMIDCMKEEMLTSDELFNEFGQKYLDRIHQLNSEFMEETGYKRKKNPIPIEKSNKNVHRQTILGRQDTTNSTEGQANRVA